MSHQTLCVCVWDRPRTHAVACPTDRLAAWTQTSQRLTPSLTLQQEVTSSGDVILVDHVAAWIHSPHLLCGSSGRLVWVERPHWREMQRSSILELSGRKLAALHGGKMEELCLLCIPPTSYSALPGQTHPSPSWLSSPPRPVGGGEVERELPNHLNPF